MFASASRILAFGLLTSPIRSESISSRDGAFLTFTSAPADDLQRLFAQSPVGRLGYLGSDIATSIPLNDEGSAYLWQFGDTIIGRFHANATRSIAAMPRNSVGTLYVNATTGVPTSTLAHSWRYNASSAQHTGFFSPPENETQWYWPQVGLRIPGVSSYTIGWRIEPAGSGLFPFATAGIDVIQLPANADGSDGAFSDPTDWPVNLPTSSLPSYLNNSFTLANAVAYNPSDDSVYLLGGLGNPAAAILARITAAAFAAFQWDQLSFLTSDGSWQPFAPSLQLRILFDNVPSETTLTYLEDADLWVTLTVNTFLSSTITARTAADPSGPWSDPLPVYAIPPSFTAKGGFCYAGKMHKELAPGPGQFAFTFNCNTDGLGPLVDAPSIYIPQIIRTRYA